MSLGVREDLSTFAILDLWVGMCELQMCLNVWLAFCVTA